MLAVNAVVKGNASFVLGFQSELNFISFGARHVNGVGFLFFTDPNIVAGE